MNRIFPSRSEWQTGLRYGIMILVATFVILNAKALTAALLPFVLAYVLSLIMEPAVSTLATRLRLGRGWSTLLVLLLIIVIGGLVITWAAAILVQEIGLFLETWPQYRQTLTGYVEQLTDRATQAYLSLPPEVVRYISENTSRLGDAVEGVVTAAGRTALSILSAIPALLTASLLILVATFFISKDLPQIREFVWSKFPKEQQKQIRSVFGDLMRTAGGYLRAQAVLITITTVVTTFGLWIVGIQSWLSAGLIIGILDMLPVVGPTVVFIPWIVYLFIVGNTGLALALLVIYGLASGARSLFEAKVVGDSVGLHPLVALMAMYTGALLWGVKGIVLGPVIFILAKAVLHAREKA